MTFRFRKVRLAKTKINDCMLCQSRATPLHLTLNSSALLLPLNRFAATIAKLLEDMLPSDIRMTSEVRDLFVECCTGTVEYSIRYLQALQHFHIRVSP